ncbi:hypothetical protein V5F01_39290 [Streptomyces sp. NRRL B-2790]|uniref:hypothetical protein n=1 Tax=Streptomyces sp. NRRL B-2790 TaxID=1463835 RepID=UPI003567A772
MPTVPRVWVRSLTVALVPSCDRRRVAICFWWVPPVSRRKAPTASLPLALAM